jgi:hypothetical protein
MKSCYAIPFRMNRYCITSVMKIFN